MSNLMHTYYYGKAGQGDYTVEQLPTNRRQLFFTTLKVRFSSMIGLNFLHFLFMLPALIWLYVAVSTAVSYVDIDTAAQLISQDSVTYQAYTEYKVYADEYEAITTASDRLALEKEELEGIKYNITAIENGETIYVEEAAVVEGGESTKRELTLAEAQTQKADLEVKISEDTELLLRLDDEDYMAQLEQNVNDTYALYYSYIRQELNGNILTSLIILIPLIMIASISRPGQAYVLRNWARDEHSFMWQDYKAAIKSNIGQTLGMGLLNGLSFVITFVAYITYGSMATTSWIYSVPQAIMVILLILWWMMNEIVFFMMVTYKMKFKDLIRNGIIISIARLPVAFLILLGTVAVPLGLLLLIPYPAISLLILVVLYGTIGFSLTSFVQASYANSCFDKFLNPRIEGAEVNKGLHVNDDDDEEDEVKQPEQKEEKFWERKTK